MPRVIAWDLRIDWAFSGSYVDESARLISAMGAVRLAAPESGITSPRGTVDQCTLTLANHDGRYSPLNSSGPLYAYLQNGGAYHAPMYLRVSIDNGSSLSRVFTGVIKIPQEGPPYPGVGATVQIDCRSQDEVLLNKRLSTPISTFRALHDTAYTEATVILNWLEQAGVNPANTAIDAGQFVIPWAWLDDESPVEDIWQLAAAGGGRFYCDQEGTYRYENSTHWLFSPHNTPRETLTEAGYGQMEGPDYNDRELYSAVTVIAAPRERMESGAVWAADATVVVPPSGSVKITAKLRQPAYRLTSLAYTAVSGGGRAMTGNIGVATVQFAQRCEITLTNSDPVYAAEVVNLALVGEAVNGSPSVEETRTSAHAFWTAHPGARPGRTRLLRGNNYIQTQAQAAALAEFLSDRYELPRLSWRLRDVPGDPFRRLGDRITLGNSQAMSANRDVFLTGINFRLSNKGFVQDLEVIDAANLYGAGAFFILGRSTLGAIGGSTAAIFY